MANLTESRELSIKPEQELILKINKYGENLTFSIWNHNVLVAASSTKTDEIISSLKISIQEEPKAEVVKSKENKVQKETEHRYGIKLNLGLISGFWQKKTRVKGREE